MTRYAVSFKVKLGGKWSDSPRTKTVVLTEGYTDFSDIPKIITLPLGIQPGDVEILSLVNLSEDMNNGEQYRSKATKLTGNPEWITIVGVYGNVVEYVINKTGEIKTTPVETFKIHYRKG
ncbi:MAG: hypothetical protein L6R40_008750 [Gallowayella cf. fulva]|nr:MAG: hypothetical protein L6R40_008750 [Xanthomendoza cf. fulva]